jgi:enamine deaminase RidA (YjgF/YER057c/UK114 family)
MTPPTQSPSERIARLGLSLPPVPTPVAAYIPAIRYADLVQTAGQIPVRNGEPVAIGTVPDAVSIEQATDCARLCALNAIAAAAYAAGGLDRLERPLKVTCFVACTPEFTQHPAVANGASHLLGEIFGDRAAHARAAVGSPSLPLGVPVEVEILFKIRPD